MSSELRLAEPSVTSVTPVSVDAILTFGCVLKLTDSSSAIKPLCLKLMFNDRAGLLKASVFII